MKAIFTKAAFDAALYGLKMTALLLGASFLFLAISMILVVWPAVGFSILVAIMAGAAGYLRYRGHL